MLGLTRRLPGLKRHETAESYDPAHDRGGVHVREPDRATTSYGASQGHSYGAAPSAHADSEPVIVAVVHLPAAAELLPWPGEASAARPPLAPGGETPPCVPPTLPCTG